MQQSGCLMCGMGVGQFVQWHWSPPIRCEHEQGTSIGDIVMVAAARVEWYKGVGKGE